MLKKSLAFVYYKGEEKVIQLTWLLIFIYLFQKKS